jgi:hypothetical protein
MKQTPIVIKVRAVYFVKLPQGEWINLASVRSVEVEEEADSLVPIDHVLVRLTFEEGRAKAYCGASSAAILEALSETNHIDKSLFFA